MAEISDLASDNKIIPGKGYLPIMQNRVTPGREIQNVGKGLVPRSS